MVRIQIPVGNPPCQIDDFPAEVVEGEEELRAKHREESSNVKEGSEAELRARHKKELSALEKRPFERSVAGAIHFRPASTKQVTEDEWKFLKTAKQHRVFAQRLVEVQVTVVPPMAAEPEPPPAPEPTTRGRSRKRDEDTDDE